VKGFFVLSPDTGNPTMVNIRYVKTADIWTGYPSMLMGLIKQYGCRRICDVGGGSTPQIPFEFIQKYNLDYALMDVSENELSKAPPQYTKLIVQDITASELSVTDRFDFIFSRSLAEHLKDGKIFHQNIYKLLNPGGIAVHLFPTLYAFPFIVNN
jgi:2-polyprenyl-3-methyl-5-hydroxy-6-metoxy-1,4-benzoquinol methylase